ncbi:uncharacterized protein LOC126734304 isoform X2 [Anthonomus grandis grandis]|uniref:uncharacterized protein LOC126734304 isoform X2 n=1 Tax=Anthonomus grandis grandis TaxID=2921223 RepID=UPI002165FA10|nr:uncharacterized protein LOC126734304 isoform X2 [Anthonomus grandis grandis]
MTLLNIRKSPLYPYVCLTTLFALLTPYVITAAPSLHSAQPKQTKTDFEKSLENFLGAYYENMLPEGVSLGSKRVGEGNDGEMQSDQPAEDQGGMVRSSSLDDLNKTKDKLRKENWVEYLKNHILSQIGRTGNSSGYAKPPEGPPLEDFNITQIIPKILNSTTFEDDQIAEKIRSFYPSCEQSGQPTQPAELDHWRDSEDVMNLFFNFDYPTEQSNSNIATATLRLYRLPQNHTAKVESTKDDCKNSDSAEEEKLLRVSVYWYTKFQKKKRVKRRLSDSKVIPENSRWVELSVKPATNAWSRAGAKNLGLGVLVEDQEGKTLPADKYFKGASCTVGVSTPKPIPTIVRDASHYQTDQLDRIHSLSGRNSTSAIHSDVLLLPTIDICYLELPENADLYQINSARINACNLRKIHEENQRIIEREQLERLATLQYGPRHIRHQRQHRQSGLKMEDVEKMTTSPGMKRELTELENTLRRSMTNQQIILTREELEEFKKKFASLRR